MGVDRVAGDDRDDPLRPEGLDKRLLRRPRGSEHHGLPVARGENERLRTWSSSKSLCREYWTGCKSPEPPLPPHPEGTMATVGRHSLSLETARAEACSTRGPPR